MATKVRTKISDVVAKRSPRICRPCHLFHRQRICRVVRGHDGWIRVGHVIRQSIIPVTRPLGLAPPKIPAHPCDCGRKRRRRRIRRQNEASVSASAIAPARLKIDLSSADIGSTIQISSEPRRAFARMLKNQAVTNYRFGAIS